VTVGSRAAGSRPGQTGTVALATDYQTGRRLALYHVDMDSPHERGMISFYPDELERAD